MSSMATVYRSSRCTAPVLIIARSRWRSRPSFPTRDTGGSTRICPGWAVHNRRPDLQRRRGEAARRFHRSGGRRTGAAARALVRRLPGAWRGRAATRCGARPGVVVPRRRTITKRARPRVVRQDADAYDELDLRSGRGLMSTSSCARLPPLAATATTLCRVRRSWTRLRWNASSPGGRSTSGRRIGADADRGRTTRFGRRVRRRDRIARALPARHPGRHRGRRPRAHARAARTARRVARRLARSSSTGRQLTDPVAPINTPPARRTLGEWVRQRRRPRYSAHVLWGPREHGRVHPACR